MKTFARTRKAVFGGARTVVGAVILGLAFVVAVPTQTYAAATGSLYSYDFANAIGVVANNAEVNTNVSMTLFGDWTATSTGVAFTGNTTDAQSVGYAKPASGTTITIPTSQAVGAAIMFRYDAPASGCFSDSPNMTQIGSFAKNVTQIKLQLSNCGKSSANVFPQCRMAGSLTPSSVLPVMGTQALADGELYVVQCVKSPDPVSGNATLELKTTRIDAVNGNQVTTDTFMVAPTGTMSSSKYLSVANKYPLPTQANNTDQFVAEVSQVAYCRGASLAGTATCLEAEVTL